MLSVQLRSNIYNKDFYFRVRHSAILWAVRGSGSALKKKKKTWKNANIQTAHSQLLIAFTSALIRKPDISSTPYALK